MGAAAGSDGVVGEESPSRVDAVALCLRFIGAKSTLAVESTLEDGNSVCLVSGSSQQIYRGVDKGTLRDAISTVLAQQEALLAHDEPAGDPDLLRGFSARCLAREFLRLVGLGIDADRRARAGVRAVDLAEFGREVGSFESGEPPGPDGPPRRERAELLGPPREAPGTTR